MQEQYPSEERPTAVTVADETAKKATTRTGPRWARKRSGCSPGDEAIVSTYGIQPIKDDWAPLDNNEILHPSGNSLATRPPSPLQEEGMIMHAWPLRLLLASLTSTTFDTTRSCWSGSVLVPEAIVDEPIWPPDADLDAQFARRVETAWARPMSVDAHPSYWMSSADRIGLEGMRLWQEHLIVKTTVPLDDWTLHTVVPAADARWACLIRATDGDSHSQLVDYARELEQNASVAVLDSDEPNMIVCLAPCRLDTPRSELLQLVLCRLRHKPTSALSRGGNPSSLAYHSGGGAPPLPRVPLEAPKTQPQPASIAMGPVITLEVVASLTNDKAVIPKVEGGTSDSLADTRLGLKQVEHSVEEFTQQTRGKPGEEGIQQQQRLQTVHPLAERVEVENDGCKGKTEIA